MSTLLPALVRRRGLLASLTLPGLLTVAALLGPAAAASAGETTLRIEFGPYRLHDRGGPGGSLRLGKNGERLSLETGITYSGDDTRHGSIDEALFFPLCRSCRVKPYLGAQLGLMFEDEYVGPWIGVLAGVDVPFSPTVGGYAVGRAGAHIGAGGPSMIGIGIYMR
jgi:hypothetical protein